MRRLVIGAVLTLWAFGALAGGTKSSRMEVPLKVTLEGETQEGRARLTAVLEVRGELPVAPVLRLVLPEGAILVEGMEQEALAEARVPGSVRRVFVVEGLGGRTATVVAEMVSAGAGARAQASWPLLREAPRVHPSPTPVPIAPVEVHGVRIHQAIPVEPDSQ